MGEGGGRGGEERGMKGKEGEEEGGEGKEGEGGEGRYREKGKVVFHPEVFARGGITGLFKILGGACSVGV